MGLLWEYCERTVGVLGVYCENTVGVLGGSCALTQGEDCQGFSLPFLTSEKNLSLFQRFCHSDQTQLN